MGVTMPRLAPGLTWSLLTFVLLSCVLLRQAYFGSAVTPPALLRRINGENVVLADCRDDNGVVSSHMAYFASSPGPKPQDVAVVQTTPGQAALWINKNTSATFTDTGVTFRATIGPKVADGEYAGTGNNGYGSFSCWQIYSKNLYTYDNTDCSQVYQCNHEKAPAVLPTPVGGTASAGATATPSSTSEASSTPSPLPPAEGGLSQGAVVGIVVGTIGGLVMIAATALFVYWRRMRRNQKPARYGSGGGCCGLFGRKELVPLPADVRGGVGAGLHPLGKQDVKGAPGTYEMDGQWYRIELASENGKYELDGQETPIGVDSKDSKGSYVAEMPSHPPHLYSQPEQPAVYAQADVHYLQQK
ncbi:hypothetical protein B0T25DRAFT_289454 [Lasiosphaeria hispida]|uniref:Mid2 domain-containing protein n=1 Tax=Lasiosphaeria hispida TaxID=260671 RepID=A0AAJ0MB09_9PEZI|nr:hypothetical protein B0T25DRAFT_289454 [Lasiosphaeria hispida]